MKTKAININDDVWVRLTDSGRAEMERQHVELFAESYTSAGLPLPPMWKPEEDADGWSRWQLHVLMNTFGHLLVNGTAPLPFETTIRVMVGGE